jgi:hypothetical protein
LQNAVAGLWTIRVRGSLWTCDLRYHDGYSVEAEIRRDGRCVIARRFQTRKEAEDWAEEEQLLTVTQP